MVENIQEEIEDKVIDCINYGVNGRLIAFKPEKKGFENYLAVKRRGKYKEKEIYFQINAVIEPAEGNNFVKDFSQEDLKTGKNFYSLFVYFNEVEQKINDYVWLIPSIQFQEMAEVVRGEKNERFLRFQSSLDLKNKNQYSKFLVETEYIGDLILDALEKGGKFDFSKMGLKEENIVNIEMLKEFLYEARKNTYVASSGYVDNPRLLASKQLEFQKGDYSYRDIFFDRRKKFIGQEIVYKNAEPVWGMNYIGSQIGKLETSFLKEALTELADKCRVGGNCEYEKREFKYVDHGTGSLEDFSGQEIIYIKDKNIYKLNYQGGLL